MEDQTTISCINCQVQHIVKLQIPQMGKNQGCSAKSSLERLKKKKKVHLKLRAIQIPEITTHIQRAKYTVFMSFLFIQNQADKSNCSSTILKKVTYKHNCPNQLY